MDARACSRVIASHRKSLRAGLYTPVDPMSLLKYLREAPSAENRSEHEEEPGPLRYTRYRCEIMLN